MCGTIMQILGEGAALLLVDGFISPFLGGGALVDTLLFLIKGMATYYVYKWFQCSSGGIIRHPMANVGFWGALVGGLVGMFTLMLTGMVINVNRGDIFLKYGIEAIILNMVYGFLAGTIQNLASTTGTRHY